MRKMLWLFLILGTAQGIQAQKEITDHDIVKMMLGRNIYRLNQGLDSLGVWYYYHFHENKSTSGQETKAKIYSIANSAGTVKVYVIDIQPVKKYLTEVVINYRHDQKQQVDDMRKMPTPDDWHIGTFSTDMVYKLK